MAETGSTIVRSISTGLSQKGVRDHNERLLLSLLQRHGDMPGSDLARLAGLSPPTVSGILKRLENDGLLLRGTPQRGKVGKPSVPMRLSPDGVLSFGLKIGRRSTDLLLMDFTGTVRYERKLAYAYPIPEEVFGFLAENTANIVAQLASSEAARICGIGVAAPFGLWNWHDLEGASALAFMSWKDINICDEIGKITGLPVSSVNDATAACQAEHVFGRGKAFRDYAYFFLGAFVGGGVVLNNSVYEGRQGNAGALGSLRGTSAAGESLQLVDMASTHLLETQLIAAGQDTAILWRMPQDWSAISDFVDPWLEQTAEHLAIASLSTCAVIDFEAILIDGAVPPDIRTKLVKKIREYLVKQDSRGLICPVIEAGIVGGNARGIGAACLPIFSQYFLNTNAGLAVG